MVRLVKWLMMAAVTGLVASTLAAVLTTGVSGLNALMISRFGPYFSPFIGLSVAAGFIYLWPHTAGVGTDRYIASINGTLRPPLLGSTLTKLIATTLTVGSGGSGGLIGPAIYMGAGLNGVHREWPSWLSPSERQSLQVTGAAAMLGALLHTPLAAGLLAVEVLHPSHLEYERVFPGVLGGVAGTSFSVLLWGGSLPVWHPFTVESSLLFAAGLTAFITAGFGIFFVRIFRAIQQTFRASPWFFIWIMVGGALTGIIGFVLGPELLGWGMVETLSEWAITPVLGARSWGLAAGKVVATALTVGPGGSGGVIGPALVIGTFVANGVASFTGLSITALAAAGMAACLGAVINAPLAAAVLMIELFGPGAALYSILGAVIGFQTARSHLIYNLLNR